MKKNPEYLSTSPSPKSKKVFRKIAPKVKIPVVGPVIRPVIAPKSSMTLYQISYVNGKASYSLVPMKKAGTPPSKPSSPKKKKATATKITTSSAADNKEQEYTCGECGLKFATQVRLNWHRSTHNPLKKTGMKPATGTRSRRKKTAPKSYAEFEEDELPPPPPPPPSPPKKAVQKSEKALMFICPSCEFSTNNRSIMVDHFSSEHCLKPSEIKIEPSEESTLDINEDEDIDEDPQFEPVVQLTCPQCNFSTFNQDDLDFHTCLPSDARSFTCHLCTYECLTRMGLQSHITRKHRPKPELNASNSYDCDECDFRSVNKTTLYAHKRRHRDGKPNASVKVGENCFYCNECDFSARSKAALHLHLQRRHKATITGEQEKPDRPEFYSCDHCDYTNKNKYEMKVHVIRKHTNEYNHACEVCGKKYKIKGDLTNHIRFQHREQPIICDVCGKTCGNSNSLYVHQKFAHYKAEFECPICHRRMVSQANLDEHVLKQHEQREDAVCEECGKTFTRQSRLKIHMRIHTGLKPHACKICGKAFARKTALRQHLLIHTGQRPYVCDICGKAFTQKPGLISHRKSHPGSHPPLPRVTIDHVLSELLTEGEGVC